VAEEIIRPESEYLKLTMAEGNVVERLRAMLAKLVDEFEELYQASHDLFQNRFEALKTRFERIRKHKKEFEDLYRHSMFYLIRVGIGLQHRDTYTRAYLELLRFAEDIEAVALRLVELAELNAKIDDSFVLGFQRFLEYIKESLSVLIDSTQLLTINANKAVEGFDKVIRNEDLCDDMYKDLLFALVHLSDKLKPIYIVSLRELLSFAEASMNSLLRVAEDLKWIALHRT